MLGLAPKLRSDLTQHAGVGSKTKVDELAGGFGGHLKLNQQCSAAAPGPLGETNLPWINRSLDKTIIILKQT